MVNYNIVLVAYEISCSPEHFYGYYGSYVFIIFNFKY